MSFISKLQLRFSKKNNQNPSSSDENARCNIADIEKAKLYAIRVFQAQLLPDTIENWKTQTKLTKSTN